MTGNLNLSVVHTFIDELWRVGVRHVCISPGSRSTPVTMSVASHGGFQVHTLLDERSGGFFALGLARRLQAPVLLVCTSGTATANYHPAVMEALQSRVPLMVLTADRPPELHHVGANQTVSQTDLFGTHVKYSVQMPVPENIPSLHAHAAATAWRAAAMSMSLPMGPVHINWPFREPLVPPFRRDLPDRTEPISGGLAHLGLPVLEPDVSSVLSVQSLIETSRRTLIVVGPQEDNDLPGAVLNLARQIGAPILADPLSGLRTSVQNEHQEWIMDAYDWFVDAEYAEKATPDVVLRFGRTPTSKGLSQYLGALTTSRQVVCSESPEWMDASFSATDVCVCSASRLLQRIVQDASLQGQDDGTWLRAWQKNNRVAREVVAEIAMHDQNPAFEGRLWIELDAFLKDFQNLFVGNSMPIRDMDGFFPVHDERVNVYANRGVSGIDGIVSCAAGTSAAYGEKTVLVIGDVSFYHDMNGLLAVAKENLPLCIILVHNDGGGIFTGLPQALVPETFSYFQTPHGLQFKQAVATYGGRFDSVSNWGDFQHAMEASLTCRGLSVVEVRTSAEDSTSMRRSIRRRLKDI